MPKNEIDWDAQLQAASDRLDHQKSKVLTIALMLILSAPALVLLSKTIYDSAIIIITSLK